MIVLAAVAKSLADVGHVRFDEAARLELMAAFGDLDRSHLARPVINVLEQMAMNGSQVG